MKPNLPPETARARTLDGAALLFRNERLCSLLLADGSLQISTVVEELPKPGVDEVIVRIEASPINPSDVGQMFGLADLGTLHNNGTALPRALSVRVPERALAAMAMRINTALPVGNEGAGTVVAVGGSNAAQALLGRTVAMLGGGMYAQYRCVKVADCLELPQGTTPEEGAASFVNPLTALGFVETARREGHSALVHTAAASSLGRMLNRLCLQDGLQLVCIVRSPEQASLLLAEGAVHVIDASQSDFLPRLTDALVATRATIAFDAVAGGTLSSDILACMEAAVNRNANGFSRYGSSTLKHVYIYGGLDTRTIELRQNFGKAWSVGGWLLTTFLQQVGPQRERELKARVASEIKTTFANYYSHRLSLSQVLDADEAKRYIKPTTGQKYLVCPHQE